RRRCELQQVGQLVEGGGVGWLAGFLGARADLDGARERVAAAEQQFVDGHDVVFVADERRGEVLVAQRREAGDAGGEERLELGAGGGAGRDFRGRRRRAGASDILCWRERRRRRSHAARERRATGRRRRRARQQAAQRDEARRLLLRR